MLPFELLSEMFYASALLAAALATKVIYDNRHLVDRDLLAANGRARSLLKIFMAFTPRVVRL
jgi:hypothetical protein